MAKPVKDYHIKKLVGLEDSYFDVWTLDNEKTLSGVLKIEGVLFAGISKVNHCVSVEVSPLYDIDDVIKEVEELLTPQPVPDAFQAGWERGIDK